MNNTVPTGLRAYVASIKDLETDADFTTICRNVASSLATEGGEGPPGAATSMETLLQQYDDMPLRNLAGAVAALYSEAGREPPGYLPDVCSALATVHHIPQSRCDILLKEYKTVEGTLRGNVVQTGYSHPRITGATSELMHVLGNRESDPRVPSAALFNVRLETNDGATAPVELSIGMEQMQDLLSILQDMKKQAERTTAAL